MQPHLVTQPAETVWSSQKPQVHGDWKKIIVDCQQTDVSSCLQGQEWTFRVQPVDLVSDHISSVMYQIKALNALKNKCPALF